MKKNVSFDDFRKAVGVINCVIDSPCQSLADWLWWFLKGVADEAKGNKASAYRKDYLAQQLRKAAEIHYLLLGCGEKEIEEKAARAVQTLLND